MIASKNRARTVRAGAATPGIRPGMNDFDAQMSMRAPVELPDSLGPVTSAPAELSLPTPELRGGSVWDRIGAELKKPGMGAALLRGAGASFRGEGLGGAIGAATGYMDQREQRDYARDYQGARDQVNDAFRERQLDQVDQGQAITFGLGTGRLEEARRSSEAATKLKWADLSLDQQKLMQDRWKHMTGLQVDREKIALGYTQETGRNTRHGTVSASTAYSTDATNYRHFNPAPKAPEAGYTETREETPAKPAVNHWFGPDEPARPKTVTTTRTPAGIGSKGAGALPAPAPANAAQRVSGRIYSTPTGFYTWTGTGWRPAGQ